MTKNNLKVVKSTKDKDLENKEKNKALEAAISQITDNFGKGSVMKLGQQKAMDVESISTGSLSLDLALGIGGLPKGRIIEIYGPESSGKTTLALQVVAEAQKAGGICGFVDAEHALDPVYAKKLGVNTEECCCPTAVGQGHPRGQIHIHFRGAGQHNLHSSGFQQPGHLQRNIKHHIRFPQAADPDSTGIRSAMTGIDDNPIAPPRHLRQSGRIHGCPGGGDPDGRSPATASAGEITFTDGSQTTGG